jgi:signal transduction histidine kinase/DNA-binding response OmpR family regulator
MRAKDWAATPLGPLDAWPQSLRTTVSTCLNSRFPIFIWWGRELVSLYNDAYREIIADKHPRSLAQRASECWAEIWDVIGPMVDSVFATGEPTWSENQLLLLERSGFAEETYFTFSYGAIRDESNAIGGIFATVHETTRQVLGERRLRTLGDLASRTADATSVADVVRRASEVLAENPRDLPTARIAESGEVQPGELAFSAGRMVLFVTPSPHLRLAGDYESFLALVGGQVATAVERVRALQEARERAEALAELDRAKTAFFSNVSHEFRTPLTLLLGPIEQALETRAPLAGADLDTAHRNALRLLKLVNALLDFSRIESGRAQAWFEPVELGTLTADLASAFRSAIENAGLVLDVDCEPLGEPVYVDRDLWEKVVLNLLSNAFKFTFEGRIEVRLRRAGERAVLEVSDTGTGIVADQLPRVFERFHRIEGARARTHEGSGIGLALVHELVKMHGGEVSATSELGRGTTFTVSLPLGSAHLSLEQRRPRPAPVTSHVASYVEEAQRWLPTSTIIAPASGRERVLIVDDNADMRDYLVRVLAERWTVDVASNAASALDLARKHPPDLVLTDVMMPGVDGFRLLRELRSDPVLRDSAVIMLSARAGDDTRVDGLSAGADDYLIKPFSPRELIARIGNRLAMRSLEQRLSRQRAAIATLFEHTPVPIAIFRGPELVFELANAAYREVVDRDPRGKPLLEALPEARGMGYDELLLEVMRTGNPYVARDKLVPLVRNGVLRDTYFTFVYAPLHDGIGDGVIAIVNDVTEQVLARVQLEKLATDARAANRAKDEFLAMLGHELRNPLAPMVTALELMRMRNDSASREQQVLTRQVGHLGRLVDDLLDVSRITSGRIELRKRRVELFEIVHRGLELASPLLEARRNRVEVEVPRTGLVIDGDLHRLAQIVSNLLTNAAKYSNLETRIAVTATVASGNIQLSVRDEGVGIAPEMLDRVFDLFVQQRQTLDRSQGGLGLGLAIARSLVELHGGSIRAFSAGAGTGSEFVVALPAAEGTLARDPSGRISPLSHLQRRVLVVDDNDDALVMLRGVLEELGCTVEVAHDGPTALDKARDFRPEIALLDIGLPVMDGYELARRMRELSRMHLVAITGYGTDSDRARAHAAGFARHLVKPVDMGDLLSIVRELN